MASRVISVQVTERNRVIVSPATCTRRALGSFQSNGGAHARGDGVLTRERQHVPHCVPSRAHREPVPQRTHMLRSHREQHGEHADGQQLVQQGEALSCSHASSWFVAKFPHALYHTCCPQRRHRNQSRVIIAMPAGCALARSQRSSIFVVTRHPPRTGVRMPARSYARSLAFGALLIALGSGCQKLTNPTAEVELQQSLYDLQDLLVQMRGGNRCCRRR